MSPLMSKLHVFLILGLLIASNLSFTRATKHIGVCYGLNGNNLPAPADVIGLYKSCGIEFLRIYEPVPEVLEALKGSGLLVAVGPRNEDLPNLASGVEQATAWVQTNIVPYQNDVVFRWITLGNEVIPGPLSVHVPGAMANVQAALSSVGITGVAVTTVLPASSLAASYPPSAGAFSPDIIDTMTEVAKILAANNAPLMLNVYPYFALASDPEHITLDYALFSSTVPVKDGDLLYYNLFDAIVDAFNAALEKIGYGNVAVAVAESGWPTQGNGAITSVANAQTYNQKLYEHVTTTGTPRKPAQLMDTFHFEMFNENEKQGLIEQSFGLFTPDMQPVYQYC